MRDDTPQAPAGETYSQWTIVNVVFDHLVEEGLHPVFGGHGDPGESAAELLRALGVTPTAEGDSRIHRDVHRELAQLRTLIMEDD